MKTILLFFAVSALSTSPLFAQSFIDSSHLLTATFSRSKAGSGDIGGFTTGVSVTKVLKKQFSFTGSLQSSFHDDQIDNFFTDLNGNIIDGSIRRTTGGVQAVFQGGYSFVKSRKHLLLLQFGPLLRYQTSSYATTNILYPIATGLPFPVVVFVQNDPARTFSIGGAVSLNYLHIISKKMALGVGASFQTDSNRDNFSHLSLSISRILR